jgi:hypothetical protein
MAGEPVSRILCLTRFAARGGDHSSRSRIAPGLQQPTRGSRQSVLANESRTGRAGPPLLFGLAPRGVCRAPDVAIRAVGSYPTFSPLPNALDRNRQAVGFASGLPPRSQLTGGIFSVALSVAVPRAALAHVAKTGPLALPGASPYAPRPCGRGTRSPDFPPAHPSRTLRPAQDKPAIARLTRCIAVYRKKKPSFLRSRARVSASRVQQLLKPCFVEDGNAELFRFVEL